MANVTVVLDDDLLARARAKAVGEGRSLNAVLRSLLQGYAGPSDAEIGAAMFADLAARSTFTTGAAPSKWRRDELHDRPTVR